MKLSDGSKETLKGLLDNKITKCRYIISNPDSYPKTAVDNAKASVERLMVLKEEADL